MKSNGQSVKPKRTGILISLSLGAFAMDYELKVTTI
jgi:hypothetical protein